MLESLWKNYWLWWPLSVPLTYGLARVFIFGPFFKYDTPLKDGSLLKKGDILLVGQKNIYKSLGATPIQLSNVLTRKLKHRVWTHAAIYAGDSFVWEAQPEGVRKYPVAEYFKGDFLVRAFRHRYINDDAIFNKVLDYCAGCNGYEYGWFGILFFALSTILPSTFNILFENRFVNKWCNMEKAYFCSELIVDAFFESGYPLSAFDGWRVKPSDFISNPLLSPIG